MTGAQALLNEALATIEDHFWDEAAGRVREAFSRDWREQEAYRGGNSNMHAIELFVQLADVLSEPEWRRRALSIATHLIHNQAAANDYLVIEHFDAAWQPWWDYNANQPAHGFRPYGLTPGHACEWSRLLLHLEAGLVREGKHPPDWLRRAAEWLFTAAMTYGWQVDGAPGMVYTVDWEKRPHVHQRVHWAVAEAAAAAAALLRRTGDFAYERWYRIMWDYIDRYLIDRANGSWHQELDRHNRPASRIWSGKPDLYHAYQATLLPRLPLAPAIAVSVVDSNR